MNQASHGYAMPVPKHQVPCSSANSQRQAQQGSPRRPDHVPSPISTPGLSDYTSDTLSENSHHHCQDAVRHDAQDLTRTLGLSEDDVRSGDTTSWEAPSFTAWLTHRRAQEARADYLRRLPQPISSPGTALNPYAGEFVPTAARIQGAATAAVGQDPATPKRAETPIDVLRVRHPWIPIIRSGSATSDPNVRREYASSIVHMGRWDEQSMQELTSKIAKRPMEDVGAGSYTVAAFAKAVHDAFKIIGKANCVAAFRAALARSAWTEMEAFWHPTLPTSLLSSPQRLPPKALTPALASVMFIGELYTHGLVPVDMVYQCLHLLVDDMSVMEQLRATRVLIGRLDHRFQNADPPAMKNVMDAITRNRPRIVPGRSALGEEFQHSDVQVQIDGIFTSVNRWGAPRPAH